jgi:hypothetical protein
MVIQGNMTVCDVVRTWAETKRVFDNYGISSDINRQIKDAVNAGTLPFLLRDLNLAVGSSPETCVEGG